MSASSNLILQAVSTWKKSQVIQLSPSYNGIPEASAWVEVLSKLPAEEDDLLNLLDKEHHLITAYLLIVLEKINSPRLKEVIDLYCERKEKLTIIEGSFSTSMDLGGLARSIRKNLNRDAGV